MEVVNNIQKEQANDCGLVSVIMPTYKQSELMHKAVESVLAQSYNNIELLVIDDNKDESYKKANGEYFASLKDSRVVYSQNEANMGSARSRNRGISLAKGNYITFLDDDDYYSAEKIEKQVTQMYNESADASVCNLILFNEDGKVIDKRCRKYLKKKEPLLTSHLKYHITGTDTMMFKAELIREVGGFDEEDLGDEFYLMYKIVQNAQRLIHVDYDGVFAIVHKQAGLSSGENKIKCEEMLLEFKKKQFSSLRRKDIRYIKMRHELVLGVTYKKSKQYIKCLARLVLASLISPFGMLKILVGIDR
ncbi:MAG: glycosyltransferase family 2 protein [Clostridia bacterium]|nr:glycosyltransferase family 2 protein [Clostridia bacterium]